MTLCTIHLGANGRLLVALAALQGLGSCTALPKQAISLSPASHGQARLEHGAPIWQAWRSAPAPVECGPSAQGIRCQGRTPDALSVQLFANDETFAATQTMDKLDFAP